MTAMDQSEHTDDSNRPNSTDSHERDEAGMVDVDLFKQLLRRLSAVCVCVCACVRACVCKERETERERERE